MSFYYTNYIVIVYITKKAASEDAAFFGDIKGTYFAAGAAGAAGATGAVAASSFFISFICFL